MNNPKIAVFTRNRDEFEYLELRPRSLFINIVKVQDVRGRDFIAVICTDNWWGFEKANKEKEDAYQVLKQRFPHYFPSIKNENNPVINTGIQDPCKFCGKTAKEQSHGCNEITCYKGRPDYKKERIENENTPTTPSETGTK